MASVLAYRPGTSGTGTASTSDDARRPSLNSQPSYRSKHSASTPPSDDRISAPITKPIDAARPAVFSFSRPALPQQNSMIRKRKRKVRSQYPSDSDDKHVEYILVASFDIDRGSIMEHQYPAPIGGDENMLAELMLPDQAHMRTQDWTMFFLHKDNAEDEEVRREKLEKRKAERLERLKAKEGEDAVDEDEDDNDSDGSLEDEDLRSVAGPPLVYVLNLVTTKQDNSVRRGAVCKAMAVCTRHPFLHIYKPLLLLALEEYFKNPVVETLSTLYDSLNAMDLSLMPRLSTMERLILQASDVRDVYVERFEALHEQRGASGAELTHSPSTGRTRNGGLPRDTHEFETVLPYNGIPIPVKVPTALTAETVGDFSLVKLIQTFSQPHATSPEPFKTLHPHLTTSGALTHPIIVLLNALLTQKRIIFIGHNLPSSTVAETVLAACALASGGLLRGFVRHAFPYTDLTKIDDLLKVPGFIAGVTNPTFSMHAEWWDLLCDLTTGRMKISPKIEPAPTTEGTAYFAPGGLGAMGGIEKGGGSGSSSMAAGLGGSSSSVSYGGDATGDNFFINSVLTAVNERRGEGAIRAKFRLWILKFTRIAAAFEELVYGASALVVSTPAGDVVSPASSPGLTRTMSGGTLHTATNEITRGYGYVWPTLSEKNRELAANATRIEGWMKTRSYYNYIQDLAVFYSYRPIKTIDLQHCHDKLVKLRLGPDNAAALYAAICSAVHSTEQIDQLLVTVVNTNPIPAAGQASATGPAAMQGMGGSGIGASATWGSAGNAAGGGGLFHLALGLFHPRLEIREKVADLLARVREHEAGRHFWNRLGGFERAAFERVESARRDREG
ncbi:spindle pole body interacting protein [Myriangium duriaei CBS 260.36]|uniref:Spindle pole body interacting protein n=1 Tax=Myriangium duriaei CBS 260.36 TaxID=1168546 RepID=A0A9P4J482_9PEZI|nr:spindle pole body interacting protein [Myriangium duriaei CBS 260.36]